MALFDFIRRGVTVRLGERDHVVVPPRGSTVFLFLSAVPDLIAAAREVWRKSPDVYSDPDTALGFIEMAAARDSVDEVLATCVTPTRPFDVEERKVLLRTLLGLCDIDRIITNLDLKSPPSDVVQEQPYPSNLETMVVMLAQKHGVSPQEVMDWGYEAMITAADVLEAQLRAQSDDRAPVRPGTGKTVDWNVSAARLRAMGIPVEEA